MRKHLPYSDLSKAVTLFSHNVHDETLPTSIQTMSCKLLLNLAECIRVRSEHDQVNGRELLMRMMEVFVLKFKTVSKLQLPVLMAKHRQTQSSQQPPVNPLLASVSQQHQTTQPSSGSLSTPSTPATPSGPDVKQESKEDTKSAIGEKDEEKKCKFGFPTSQASSYTVADCRALVKTLVCGVKTATWGCTDVGGQNKQFQAKETMVYIRLVKWAMEALDIYTLNTTPGQPTLQV